MPANRAMESTPQLPPVGTDIIGDAVLWPTPPEGASLETMIQAILVRLDTMNRHSQRIEEKLVLVLKGQYKDRETVRKISRKVAAIKQAAKCKIMSAELASLKTSHLTYKGSFNDAAEEGDEKEERTVGVQAKQKKSANAIKQ